MAFPTLAFDAAFATATALVYAYVGELTRRRTASDPDGRRALLMFSVWWYGLAALTFVGAVQSTLGALGVLDLNVFVAFTFLTLPLLVAVLWGLVYYLLYIYTGKASLFWPVAGFHLALLAGFAYLIVWLRPTSVVANDWSVSIQYANTASGPIVGILLFSILGPVLFAALGYGTLLFRTNDATTRYRVGMVAGAFILWFGSAAVAASIGLGNPKSDNYWYWWPVVARTIALVSTFIILLAYRPPRTVRERLGVEGVEPKRPRAADTMRRLAPVAIRLKAPAPPTA